MSKAVDYQLNPKLYLAGIKQEPIRNGFGRGLVAAGQRNSQVVALCADLTGSTRMDGFAEAFPERFVEVGVAEQNLVTVASGMAHMGKIPFTSSYAAFSPGRNWEQIRTTICLNDRNVKIVGSHAGVSVGPDGATHQMLEDIALMRVLPNMQVIVPCDTYQAEAATLAIAAAIGPMYIRLARADSPILTTPDTPFEIGRSYVYRAGSDITLIACGATVYHALIAAEKLSKINISAEVINCATIKPLDKATIITSASKTKRVITIEEAQITAGLGGAIAELLGEELPTAMRRIGMLDRFGESGEPDELFEHFGLSSTNIVKVAKSLLPRQKSAAVKSATRPKPKTAKKSPKKPTKRGK